MKGDLFAFFLIGVAIVVFIRFLARKAASDKHYDEMQMKLRADGYRCGFFVSLAALLVLIFLLEMGAERFFSASFGCYVALMLGIISFALYCVMHEAFFTIDGGNRTYIIVFLIITAVNGGIALQSIRKGNLLEGGIITFDSGANLVSALSFLAILIALIIKRLKDRAEEVSDKKEASE